MPGLTTNDEWGYWKDSGKVVLGIPPVADKTRYQEFYAKKYGVPIFRGFTESLEEAVKMVGDGAGRHHGECSIPLYIWKKPEFQGWYRSQKEAGNTLVDARVVYTLRVAWDPKQNTISPAQRDFLPYGLCIMVFIECAVFRLWHEHMTIEAFCI